MKAIGIDGIYFQSQDPARLRAWYAKYLGINQFFFVNDKNDRQKSFSIAWSPLEPTDKIFSPGKKELVISYRVDDLKSLDASLNQKGINAGSIEERPQGKLISFLDPEGNKVILAESASISIKPGTPQPDRVTGLGGVFFKTTDVKNLKAWYGTNLGLDVTDWGCTLEWIDPWNRDSETPASTAWSPFDSATRYFDPSQKNYMFNYRVKDLHALLAALKSADVQTVGDPQEESYGKFGWIMDPDGNKIEFWEPIDGGF